MPADVEDKTTDEAGSPDVAKDPPAGKARGSRRSRLEGADRESLDHVWWSSKRWVAAVVIAVFPLIFIIDEAIDPAFSPVLPGLVALALLIILLPLGVMELRWRRLAKKRAQVRRDAALRGRQTAHVAFIVAWVWLLLWLALGA